MLLLTSIRDKIYAFQLVEIYKKLLNIYYGKVLD